MTPAMGQVLGPAGINIGEFIKKFNEASKEMRGDMVPAEISVYEDRSYDFVLKTPPVSSLFSKHSAKRRGAASQTPLKIGTLTKAQLKRSQRRKMPDLNAHDIDQAMKVVAGSARSWVWTLSTGNMYRPARSR
jgi:large subunit ribosomal protein L11